MLLHSTAPWFLFVVFLIVSAFLTMFTVRGKKRATDDNPRYMSEPHVAMLYFSIILVPWAYSVIQGARYFVLPRIRSRKRTLLFELCAIFPVVALTVASTLMLFKKPRSLSALHADILKVLAAWGLFYLIFLLSVNLACYRTKIGEEQNSPSAVECREQ